MRFTILPIMLLALGCSANKNDNRMATCRDDHQASPCTQPDDASNWKVRHLAMYPEHRVDIDACTK